MFTGLIESMGVVQGIEPIPNGRRLAIVHPAIAAELAIGESVAINGVCLTVVAIEGSAFHFDVGPETLIKTNLGRLKPGDRVNLERSLRVGDRLGGHWVQGHVDGVGRIASRRREGDWEIVTFDCPRELTSQMVSKGSIAVDGVSLTLVNVKPGRFTIMLIPHTLANTTLGLKQAGDEVNLETDILGKYVLGHLEGRSHDSSV